MIGSEILKDFLNRVRALKGLYLVEVLSIAALLIITFALAGHSLIKELVDRYLIKELVERYLLHYSDDPWNVRISVIVLGTVTAISIWTIHCAEKDRCTARRPSRPSSRAPTTARRPKQTRKTTRN